jgi:polyhydroxyalkanoate synthesis regulator phasin
MEELRKQLEELEKKQFQLDMVDIWDSSDYRYAWELRDKIKEIKNKLKELENKLSS